MPEKSQSRVISVQASIMIVPSSMYPDGQSGVDDIVTSANCLTVLIGQSQHAHARIRGWIYRQWQQRLA